MVVWNKKILLQTGIHDEKDGTLFFDKLSPIVGPFIDEILKAVEKYMPNDDIIAFRALDQTKWIEKNANQIFVPPSITSLAKLFGLNASLLGDQFFNLAHEIVNDLVFWCAHKKSEASFFWTEVFDNFEVPTELTFLIKKALVIPYSR